MAGLLLLAHGASGAQPDDWRERAQLTGDWGSLRTRLAERGVTLHAAYTTGFWSNLDGGFDTGIRYEGYARWGVNAELGPLTGTSGWSGTSFHIDWSAYHGGNPSDDLVGPSDAQLVSGWEADDAVRFYQIYVAQELLNGALLVKAGQMAADEDFFQSDYAEAFLNATFGDFTSLDGAFDGPVYPLAAPGIYAEAHPTPAWVGRAGVYTADAGRDEGSNWGFDWTLGKGEGTAFAGEVGTQRSPFGLPGAYTLGAFGDTADTPNFETGRTADGFYALYAMLDQVVLLDAKGGPRLGAFVRFAWGPQEDRDVARYHVDGGVVLFDPFPGRDRDLLGLAFAHADFADDYVRSRRAAGQGVSRHETVLELTYRAQVTGWLTVQPDLQLVLDPHLSRSDAFVFGINAVITF